MEQCEVLVLGLGAMGSAAAYQLAKRGVKTIGLDRFAPPHDLGSSHGDSRITRLAIGEGVAYSPLAMRSHEIWREIEKETGADLMRQTGGLIITSPSKTSVLPVENFFATTVAAAREHGIAHEILEAADIRRRFPQFAVREDEVGYYEPDAGFLRPEICVRTQLALAQKYGAELRTNEKVLGFEPSAHRVRVTTERDTYEAERLIVAAGAWMPQLIAARYARLFTIRRQVLFWFAVNGAIEPFLPGNFPVFIWELQGPERGIYGFPNSGRASDGVKVATHGFGPVTTPETVDRTVRHEEAAEMHATYIAPYLPALDARCVKAVVCLYTILPGDRFLIDFLPESDRIIVASPCSGHGFKHSAAIGEALAEMATGGNARLDLSPFRFSKVGF
jgi:sarcosine oxidase